VLDVARERGASHFVLLSAICVQKPLLEFQRAKLKLEAELQVRLRGKGTAACGGGASGQGGAMAAGSACLFVGVQCGCLMLKAELQGGGGGGGVGGGWQLGAAWQAAVRGCLQHSLLMLSNLLPWAQVAGSQLLRFTTQPSVVLGCWAHSS
jgi:hypothetical protein